MSLPKNIFSKVANSIALVISAFFVYLVSTSQAMAQLRNWDDLDGKGTASAANSCLVNGVPTLKCLEVVVGNLLFISNVLILLVLFIMFVIGSIKYLLSLGNPEKIEGAKGTFKWAIIGLVIYISAYAILNIIDKLFLGGTGIIFQFKIGD